MNPFILLSLLFVSLNLLASLGPSLSLSIPRQASHHYLTDGIFEGGKSVRANLEALRFSKHKKEGFERWVFDFSDATTRTVGGVAPQFQVRYLKAEKIKNAEGVPQILQPAKIIITLKGIYKNNLNKPTLQKMARKSYLVSEVISYPPIEEGDTAIEMILKDTSAFYAHQPKQNEGRLVIDIALNTHYSRAAINP